MAEALIDAGADLDAPDGSIGTPVENAVGYDCWHVARLLVARGARVDKPWVAAALGVQARLEELLGDDPDPQDVSQAFWHACSGAQRRSAEYLLSRRADLAWVPDYARGTPLDTASGYGTRRENVISWLRDLGAPRPATKTGVRSRSGPPRQSGCLLSGLIRAGGRGGHRPGPPRPARSSAR